MFGYHINLLLQWAGLVILDCALDIMHIINVRSYMHSYNYTVSVQEHLVFETLLPGLLLFPILTEDNQEGTPL